ncbi:ribonuclease HII [Humidisolicoccus flavus]|uniref:ribonuclease HII n=1 Tax=Humidisolicoccus flavus TaxID=3111414 RepID=UPI003246DC0D
MPSSSFSDSPEPDASPEVRPEVVALETAVAAAPAIGFPTLDVERQLWSGHRGVIGIDEVGRGAIAGPVSVGALYLEADCAAIPEGLRDSKLLTERKRERIAPLAREWGLHAVGHASAAEIDEYGIVRCLGLAARRALEGLHAKGVDVPGSAILLDGSHDWLSVALQHPLTIHTRVKADRDCASVSGAALIAKVERDALMKALANDHEHYGWSSNKGYGAKSHYQAIEDFGMTNHHRTTWIRQPVGRK